MGETNSEGYYNVKDLATSEDSLSEKEENSGILKFFKSITSGRVVSKTDLEPVLSKTKEHLIEKNVAASVAQHICDSISKSIEGKKISTFKSNA